MLNCKIAIGVRRELRCLKFSLSRLKGLAALIEKAIPADERASFEVSVAEEMLWLLVVRA
jgi:hypothetical protein